MSADRNGTLALSTTAISSSLSQILSGKPLQHATLGAKVQDLSSLITDGVRPAWPQQGVLIRQAPVVIPSAKTASTTSSLLEGDVITRIDRDAFDGTIDLGERLLDYHPGTNVTVYGWRKGVEFQANVTLGATTTSELVK